MWTCWFFECATISPALSKHCHEPRVLHSRCLLLIIEKLIGFMSGTGQYQPSSAIIIGMLAGSRSCFTSNNSFTLLHSPLTMKARGIRLPLRRWTSNQSSSNIYPYTHESGSITGGVCSDEGQRERVWTKSNMTHRQMKPESGDILCLTVGAGAAGNTSFPFSLLNTRHGTMQVSIWWAST